MDQLCSRIKSLTLVPVEDQNKYQNYPQKSMSIVVCTPELHHYLAEIIYKCSIIKTIHQFVPAEDITRKDKNYEAKVHKVVTYANRILNYLENQLGLQEFMKQPECDARTRFPEQVENLVQLNQLLEPLFDLAQKLISSTNDRLGITDRLFGYRNNLSRNGLCNYKPRHPLELGDSLRPPMAPRFNVPGWNIWKIESSNSNPTYHNSEEFKQWKANAAERAGIAVDYPGQSETRSAYTKPPRPVTDVLNNHGKVVPCQPGYRINPNVDLHDFEYQLPKSQPTYEGIKSEYSIAFQYPDAKQANLCPWKRSEY